LRVFIQNLAGEEIWLRNILKSLWK
jgi:hypothetical protein